MNKTCKKILTTVFLMLCLVASLFAIVACGDKTDNGDGTAKYTVTVQTSETSPAKDVEVSIRKGATRLTKAKTDANGKAEFDLVPDDYNVTLDDLPAHYTVPQDAPLSLSKDNRTLTVTLTEKFAYKIYLVNPDGTPFYAAGVRVGICSFGGTCLATVPLEEGGLARCEGDFDNYHVQIKALPAGFTFERGEGVEIDYYTREDFLYFPESPSEIETEMTITIYPVPNVTAINQDAEMSSAEKADYAAKNSAYTADDLTAYYLSKELAVGETAYYSFTPTVSGDYRLYTDNSATYLRNSELTLGNQGYGVYGYLNMEAGSTYYLNVSNNKTASINAEFVLELPAATHVQFTGAGTVNATISKANQNAVVELAPTAGASYKITVLGQPASIKQFDSDSKAANATHTAFTANAEISVKFTEDMIGSRILYFSVGVESPASFQIKVEKLYSHTNTTTTKTVGATLTKFNNVTDDLVAVSYNQSNNIVYNETDHFYHFGSENGPVVVVMLTKKSNRLNYSGGLVYLEEFNQQRLRGSNPFLIDVTTDANKEDLSKGNTYVDYRAFLRGFSDYDFKANGQGGYDYVRPSTSDYDTQKYYANFVNSDGVYPLTEELKDFLKGFAAQNADAIVGGTEENNWVFACYYYGEVVTDPIVGDYNLSSITEKVSDESTTFNVGDTYSGAILSGAVVDSKLTADSAILRINADGTLTVLTYDSDAASYLSEAYVSGTWEKATDYSFTVTTGTLTYSNGTFTYVSGDITITFSRAAAE